MNKDVIFPLIDVEELPDNRYRYSTYIRKQGGNVWYKSLVMKEFTFTGGDARKASQEFSRIFIAIVYNHIVLALVNVNLKDIHGNFIWEKDENQDSESQRLKKMSIC